MILVKNSIEGKTLSVVRPFLALLVVFIHTSYPSGNGDSLYFLLNELIARKIAIIAVPCFFMISGYLFYVNKDNYNLYDYRNTLMKKSRTLLVPYLFWNVLGYYSLFIVRGYDMGVMPWDVYKIMWNGYDVYSVNSIIGYSFAPITVPYGNSVLWFVRDIMIVMIFSYPLYFIIKRYGFCVVFLLIACRVFYIGLPISGFGIDAFCFFSIGAYFSIRNHNIISWLGNRWKYVLVMYIGGLVVMTNNTYNSPFLDVSYQILGGAAIISVAYYLVKRESSICPSLLTLSESSFFIYAFHNITLFVITTKPILHLFGIIPYVGCSLGYLFVTTYKVAICVALFYLLKLKTPSFLSLIVGGRIK